MMRAAFKVIDLEPPIGFPMGGYEDRDHGAEGIHDPITGSVLLLDDESRKAAIVSMDVMVLDSVVLKEVGRRVEAETTISRENIILSPTLTHASDDGTGMNGIMEKVDEVHYSSEQWAYYDKMIGKIAELIINADRSLQPARIGYGVSRCVGLGTNRNDVHGYYDTNVYMIKVEDLSGNLIGLLVNHACMPTVLDSSNYLYSADYIGAFRQTMTEVLHKEAVMFLQGAAGVASCRHTRKESTYKEAKRLSNHLSAAVIDKMDDIEMGEQIEIQSLWDDIRLPVKEYDDEGVMQRQIAEYKKRLSAAEKENVDTRSRRTLQLALYGAERNLREKRGKISEYKEITTRIQYLNLGVCALAVIPPCTFGEIGRDVCVLLKIPCFTVGSHDHPGYVVSKEGFEMDCYEKNFSYFDEQAHDKIVEGFADLCSSI